MWTLCLHEKTCISPLLAVAEPFARMSTPSRSCMLSWTRTHAGEPTKTEGNMKAAHGAIKEKAANLVGAHNAAAGVRFAQLADVTTESELACSICETLLLTHV